MHFVRPIKPMNCMFNNLTKRRENKPILTFIEKDAYKKV